MAGLHELAEYRNRASEQSRVADLMGLLPLDVHSVLEIGARDGYISLRLAERGLSVTSLDLEKPLIKHQNIRCVQGDVTALEFPDKAFDLVFCSEVLEHIPPGMLRRACREIVRVATNYVLIGVPFRQDIRLARTTCGACGKVNPPWGHVNRFDEALLCKLFPDCEIIKTSFIGKTKQRTNYISCLLMDIAGNPYGTYVQEEPCVHCGSAIGRPRARSFVQKACTKAAVLLTRTQVLFAPEQPVWIHVLLKKRQPHEPFRKQLMV